MACNFYIPCVLAWHCLSWRDVHEGRLKLLLGRLYLWPILQARQPEQSHTDPLKHQKQALAPSVVGNTTLLRCYCRVLPLELQREHLQKPESWRIVFPLGCYRRPADLPISDCMKYSISRRPRRNWNPDLSLWNSAEIFVLGPKVCTRIWVRALIGLSIADWKEIRNAFPVIHWIRCTQYKDFSAASLTLLIGV